MIKMPNNWNEVQEFSDKQKLPLGAYVGKVKKAVVQSTDWGDQLCLVFDIAEGEYKDFFKNEFDNNQQEGKKWKGVLKQWLPKEDGSEKDEWTKRSLKGMVTAFEKSNLGFRWNWDESSLAGKTVGVLMRKEEWEYNGQTGWAVRPFRAISADKVRSGDFTLPADRPLKNKEASGSSASAPATDAYGFQDISTDDIPF